MTQNFKKKVSKRKVTVKIKEKNSKSKKLYFGKEAHEAIIRYQSTDCRDKKHKIYEKEIRNSFTRLAENLIYIHGFARDPSDFSILKSDCVSFLYETLEKFDPARGSKAFSYFNVCAKHFLIIQTNKKNKNSRRSVRLDNFSELSARDKAQIEKYDYLPSPESILIFKEDKQRLFDILNTISKRIKNENEKLCVHAVVKLFDSIEDLEFLNKRAVFVYLREISGLNPKQLSVAMSGIRKHFREIIRNNEEYQGIFKIKF